MRLGWIGALAAATGCALAGATAAQAHEYTPAWGYAFIDDSPFSEPGGGALLPTTQVFPRGHIRDVPPADGKDVRITVNVFTHGTGTPAASYHVDEGDFVDVSLDRRIDIAPFQVAYVKYDFCRFDPGSGAIEVCEPALRLGRPQPPPPPPDDGAPIPPQPVDRDGDGVPAGQDCDDTNATVFPGGREVPGNGLDDDCGGGDQPAPVSGTVQNRWKVAGDRVRVMQLRVRQAPADGAVEVRCRGTRCPFRAKKARVAANGTAKLRRFFRGWLRPRMTIEVRITASNAIGKVVRYPIRRGRVPQSRILCLPPGTTKPRKRC